MVRLAFRDRTKPISIGERKRDGIGGKEKNSTRLIVVRIASHFRGEGQ